MILYREQNGFVSLSCCAERLEIYNFSIVEAVYSSNFPVEMNGMELTTTHFKVKMDWVDATMNEIFIEAQKIYWDAD